MFAAVSPPGPRPGHDRHLKPGPTHPPEAHALPAGAHSRCPCAMLVATPSPDVARRRPTSQHPGGSLTTDLSPGASATPPSSALNKSRWGALRRPLSSAHSAEHRAGTHTHTRGGPRARSTVPLPGLTAGGRHPGPRRAGRWPPLPRCPAGSGLACQCPAEASADRRPRHHLAPRALRPSGRARRVPRGNGMAGR